jgi:hypothetical protein
MSNFRRAIVSPATKTTDHDTVRSWAKKRGGHPATVAASREGEAGILRMDFDSTESEGPEPISWEQSSDPFERSKLAFLDQKEIGGGQTSRFDTLVRRD